MISYPHHATSVVLSQLATDSATAAEPTQAQHVLSTIDQALCGVAVVLAAGVGAWWVVSLRRDPLEGAPARPNRLREDAVALAVLVYLVTAGALDGLVGLATGEEESVLATLLAGNGAHIAGIGICLIIAAKTFDGGIRRFWIAEGALGNRSWVGPTVVLTLAAVGLCPVIRDATVSVMLHFAPDYEFRAHPTIQALHDRSQPLGIHAALWAGAFILAPFAEEFFFRGLVQTLFVRLLRRRWLAIGLSSLAFGAVHFTQPHAVPALVALALLIGYAYERTGSLAPPILIHAAFNLKTLMWDALGGSSP